MKRFVRISALGLAFTVGLVACSGTVGLDEENFDPTESAADLLEVASVLDNPVLVSLAESSTLFNSIPGAPQVSTELIDAGWKLALADGTWDVEQAGEQLIDVLPPDPEALILIPTEFRGRTYVYEPNTGQYC